MRAFHALALAGLFCAAVGLAAARPGAQAKDPLTSPPDASIDLRTTEGVAQVKGQWRYSDVKIVDAENQGKKTYDYVPHANQVAKPEFDDSAWEAVDPTTLAKPRSGGKVCFSWYRITVTVPEKVGDFDSTGSTVVFQTTVDDYGEIWVNGSMPRYQPGQGGGSVVAGFNAPNRLVVKQDAKPGDKITLAVFGINGPISRSPANSIFLRGAKLDFYKKQ
jgi:gluconolactonase